MKRIPDSFVHELPTLAELRPDTRLFAPVYADSPEVIGNFYEEKIRVLEYWLKKLNLLENAREIAFLCREITGTKRALQLIQNKYLNAFRK